ncbi:ATP-binding protein [Candidatus Venteria ishoeyi]|uniref:Archaeal ATPase n=1 Tax=Candidatus Venteria ishoeyi TaxID=1899563 RepID=A0A1H6F659_9GAMM|nr:hypothetical protein [Candidatus Venteria ishoeyi]SEH04465.1 Archaeal ATPase [Candidatus Venteria ishoeyi]
MLLLKPDAWRDACAKLKLKPDFTLSELNLSQWHSIFIRQIIWTLLFWQPLSAVFISMLALAAIGKPLELMVLAGIYAWLISAVGGFFGALTLSCAFALPTALIAALSIALAHGDNGALWSFVGVMLALGCGGSIAGRLRQVYPVGLWQKIGGVILAILLSLLLLTGSSAVIWWLGTRHIAVLLMAALLGISLVALVAVRRHWRGGRQSGTILLLLLIVLLLMMAIGLFVDSGKFTAYPLWQTVFVGVYRGLAHALFAVALLSTTYYLALKLADADTALLTGILCSGTVYTLGLAFGGNHPVTWIIIYGLVGLSAGFSFFLWLPCLLYPLQLLWLRILHRYHFPLHWHPAFWDEQQYLPLYGLDNWLVRHYQQDANAVDTACKQLAIRPQAWAVSAAHLKLAARFLQNCTEESAIAAAHEKLSLDGLSDIARNLLRKFHYISQDFAAALRYQEPYYYHLFLREVLKRLESLEWDILQTDKERLLLGALHTWRNTLETAQADSESKAQTFIDNLYVVGSPLNQQQLTFVGRRDIARELEELVCKPACPPLLLYGQRRMGKTSLLYHLPSLLPGHILPLVVNIQGLPVQANYAAEFFFAIASEMQTGARIGRGIELPAFTPQYDNAFFAFNAWLDQLERQFPDTDILLMLDEVFTLDNTASSPFQQGRLERAKILGFLRHQLQHRQRLKIILVGSHLLHEMSAWATYLINVHTVQVGDLAREDVYYLAEQHMQNTGLGYTQQARERLWQLVRGHPALVQGVCREIVTLKNKQPLKQRFNVNFADVNAAIQPAIQSMAMFFMDMFQGNSTTAVTAYNLLGILAEKGENAAVPAAILCNNSDESTVQALALLLRREILVQNTSGYYAFRLELVRQAYLVNS